MSLSFQSRLYAGIVLALILLTVVSYYQSANILNAQQQNFKSLSEISKGVFELNLIITEHLSIRSKRSEEQWKIRHASLTNLVLNTLIKFEESGLSTKPLLKARADLVNIRKLFLKIIITENFKVTNDYQNKKFNKILQRLTVQIILSSQQIISNITRAGSQSLLTLKKAENQSKLTALVVMLAAASILISMMIWIQRKFLNPILQLNKYSNKLLKGDYHSQLVLSGDNELSKLSTTFSLLAKSIADKIDNLTENTVMLESSKARLEHALVTTKATQRQYKDVFISSADAIITISDSGIISTCNPATLELFGYTESELIGNNIKLLVSDEVKSQHDQFINNYLTTGKAKIIGIGRQVVGVHKNGSLIELHLKISEIKRNNKIQFIGILRDISEEVAARKTIEINKSLLENTNKELESYAYSISHDLRSPLRSIDGFSMILLEDYADKLDDEGKDYLNRIRSSTHKMGNLISDLLKMSRITKEGLNTQDLNLTTIAYEEIAILKTQYPHKIIKFSCTDSLSTSGDRFLLQSVIENILSNAVKYSQNRNPIRIEMGSIKEDDKTIFFIKDNGVGFDMKYKNKLFKAFQRLHKGNEFEGSGIGLATVQRIINRHGGEIWAKAEVDKGACFYFTLGHTGSKAI